MSKLRLPFFLFLLWTHDLSAQDLQLSFHYMDQEEGLSHADRYQFYQDAQGFCWISTKEGLNRFDGKNIVKFVHDPTDPHSIAENLISSPCFEDGHGDLWFSSFGMVQCYRKNTEKFEAWSLSGSDLKYYNAFYLDDKGQFWLSIGTDQNKYLYLFDTNRQIFSRKIAMEGDRAILAFDNAGHPTHLLETKLPSRSGMVWRSINGEEIIYQDFAFHANGNPRTYPSPTNAAFMEGDSLVWVGVYDGLGVFYPKTNQAYVITDRVPGILSDLGWVFGIVPLDSKRLLLSCTFGLLVFDKEKRQFIQQIKGERNDPLSLYTSVPFEEMNLSPSGTLWISREKMGICFADLRKKKFISVPNLSGSIINSILEDSKGNIWCSSVDSGAYLFNRERRLLTHFRYYSISLYPDEKPALPAFNQFIEDSLGGLWGRNDNTFFYCNVKKSKIEVLPSYVLGVTSTDANRINTCLKLQNGRLLAAFGKEILYLSLNLKRPHLYRWHDFSNHNLGIITALFEDQAGRIYAADQEGKLFIFNEKEKGIHLLKKIENIGICNSFLETKEGIIYAATSKGLLRIEPETWESKCLNEVEDGLPNEFFFQVIADKKGALWLSSANGLIRYELAQKQYHRFSKADGLKSLGGSLNTFIAAASGDFWFGGKNGLNIFRPEQVSLLPSKPTVRITQLWVNDQVFDKNNMDHLSNLEFDYQDNSLSFRFAALDFSDPGSNQFYYRLNGFEKEWIFNGTKDFVRYSNIPPGAYTFEVKATNSDGILNENAFNLNIRINPPFWRTWWFYLICLLGTASLIYAWFWYRLQQALKIERMRVQISSDLHDDVGTLLAGLAMQSEALEISAAEKDKTKLRRLSEISRNAMSHMRDTVWAIDARKDKLENLIDRMREHAEETLTPRDIHFDISVENVSLKQNMSSIVRQSLYLIYKEAVTNAAKHTNGDRVLVSLKKDASGFEMRIFDNGQVPEKVYKTTGSGTSNMQMRAKKIGGTLEISREGGFCVVLRVKERFRNKGTN